MTVELTAPMSIEKDLALRELGTGRIWHSVSELFELLDFCTIRTIFRVVPVLVVL